MGEAAKKLKNLISAGGNDSLVKAVGTAEDIFGTMSGFYGYYGAAKDILGKLGFLGTPEDPLEKIADLLNHIVGQLNAILGEILVTQGKIDATSKLITALLTEKEKASVETAFEDALVYTKNPSPYNKEQYDLSLNDSWTALNLLSSLSLKYWERLFVEDGLYSDSWIGPFYPDAIVPESEYIWDHRYALPQYLQILQRQLFIISANSAEFQNDSIPRLKELGDFLFEKVYKRILSGFGDIRPPDADEFKYVIFAMHPENFYWYRKEGSTETFGTYDFIDPTDGRPVQIRHFSQTGIDWLLENRIPGGRWIQSEYALGAVERYSGYDCTATYPPDELKAAAPLIAFSVFTVEADLNNFTDVWWSAHAKESVTIKQPAQFESFYNHFRIRHGLRTLRKGKELYRELGLPELCQTICHYYSILKLPLPDELITFNNQFTSSSVRETYQEIHRCLNDNPLPEAPISVRAMVAILEPWKALLPPVTISLRQTLLLDEQLVLL